MALHHYLAQDRLRALAAQRSLPAHCEGVALFADISGFTPLTEALTQQLGERRGVEALTRVISGVYDALIAAVEAQGGSTVSLAGDATLSWFDTADDAAEGAAGTAAGTGAATARRAVLAALAMQRALQALNRNAAAAAAGAPALALKVSVASGPARRFTVGDAAIQTIDVLAGPAVARVAAADALAEAGDVLLDEATALAVAAPVLAWRGPAGARLAVLDPAWPGPPAAARLATAAAGPPAPGVAAERLRPWVLPFVYERELAGQGLFVTDLRPVVALFLRFGGLEDAQGALDDAAVQRLDDWTRRAQAVLQQHGGVLLELIVGDKGSYMYAAFGAAVAHEDDARRALGAALALRALFEPGSAAPASAPPAAPTAGMAPTTWSERAAGACIGVASGTLRVGGYGGQHRQSFGAQGDAVNAAARLMMLAQPGEILASGRVRAAVAQAYALQPRPPIALKGKAEPMPVFALLGPQPPRARALQAADFVLPMVGREAALQQLAQQLARAQQGQGALLLVQAEAGMGKSRLLAEGVRLALAQGFVAYGGAASGEGPQAPYRVWQGIWTALLGLDPALPPRQLARALEAAVLRCAPEQAEAWPLLGPALGLTLAPGAPQAFTEALAPQDRKALLQALLLQALRTAAADAAEDGVGLLLVLEDLHEADALSLELLAAVLRAISAWPVLVLASQRPPEGAAGAAPGWPAAAATSAAVLGVAPQWRIELPALDAAQAEQLIRAQLAAQFPERSAAVPALLIERITERAQGNPFYIEELLKQLCDRGLDPHRHDTWQALDWPVSLRSLMLSRIDRLAVRAQLALKRASVVGAVFTAAVLQDQPAADADAPALQQQLQQLCEAGLLQRLDEPAMPPDTAAPRFAFRHRVMQEVAYESIGQPSRLRLHEQVALRLEAQRGADGSNALARALAHHWARAERPDRAWPYLLEAAAQAEASHANEEALQGYTQVLAWLPADAQGARADVLLRREALGRLLGRHEQRRQDLAALEALATAWAEAGAHPAEVLALRRQRALRGATLELDVGRYAEAAAQAQAALAAPAAEPAHEVEALLLLARVRFAGGQAQQALAPLAQAAALAQQHGLAALQANAGVQRGLVEWQLGHYDEAEARLQAALPAIQASGALRAELDLLNNLGVVAKARARFAQAVAHYAQARALARRIGDRSGEGMLLNNMASAGLAAGDFYQAAQDSAQAAQIWAELQEPAQLGAAWGNQAEAHRELGQYGLAQRLGDQALALLRSSGQRRIEAIVLENLGRVALAQGQAGPAQQAFEQALALAREIGLRAIEASTLADLGRLHLGAGQLVQARTALQAAGALMQTLGDPLGRLDVQTSLAELALQDSSQPLPERLQAAHAALAEWLPRLQPPALPAAGSGAAAAATTLTTSTAATAATATTPGDAIWLPIASYRVAWRVLQARGDPAAEAVRSQALAALRARAARIPEPGLRQDYLQLAEHQVLWTGVAEPLPAA